MSFYKQLGGNNKRILTCLVEDEPGVLERIVSLIRRRMFNIASLTVDHCEREGFSRMTIRVEAGDVEQVRKQLDKLINVIEVKDVTKEDIVIRELALITVKTTPATRGEIIQTAGIFRANIVDVALESLVIEVSGDEEKIEALINLLLNFGIKEIVRTGLIATCRGGHTRTKKQQAG
ncbi:MAG: acetolactate synthase small subunit [Candidatus Wildermuthbacteria bacterium]|nr:acetolactate synthase small subunit [Candidatus Wildermuthbacteria bacterium]